MHMEVETLLWQLTVPLFCRSPQVLCGAQYYVQAYGGLALGSFMNQEASTLEEKCPPMLSKLIWQKHHLIS